MAFDCLVRLHSRSRPLASSTTPRASHAASPAAHGFLYIGAAAGGGAGDGLAGDIRAKALGPSFRCLRQMCHFNNVRFQAECCPLRYACNVADVPIPDIFRAASNVRQQIARKMSIQCGDLHAAGQENAQTRQEGGRFLVKCNVRSRRYLRALFAAIRLRPHPWVSSHRGRC